jgi:hypothetical protein
LRSGRGLTGQEHEPIAVHARFARHHRCQQPFDLAILVGKIA